MAMRAAHWGAPALVPYAAKVKESLRRRGFTLLWSRRDEVFFQPLYDYYVLPSLDRLKAWKDRAVRGAATLPEKREPAATSAESAIRP